MKLNKLSSSYASLGQIMVLLFFVPFILFVGYIVVTKNRSSDGFVFLSIILGIFALVFKMIMSYADVSIEDGNFLVEKFFFVKKKPITEYKFINTAILPFTYYIEFANGKKVYFVLRYSEIFKQLSNSDTDSLLKELRTMFNDEKNRLNDSQSKL